MVFIPKCRRRILYGELRPHLGEVGRQDNNRNEVARGPARPLIGGGDSYLRQRFRAGRVVLSRTTCDRLTIWANRSDQVGSHFASQIEHGKTPPSLER